MKYALLLTAVLTVAVVFGLAIWGVDNVVRAQNAPPAPANVNVVDGDTPGDVIITWDAVSSAKNYRVGWVAFPDYEEISLVGGRPWSEAFAFVDVENLGQTSRTVRRLTPGTLYAFRVGTSRSVNETPAWSGWTRFTLQTGSAACPPDTGTATPTPTPTPSPTPTATPRPTPVAGSVNTDRDALLRYRGENWGSLLPLGEWQGVSTDADGRVIRLVIRGSQFHNQSGGSIPPELGNLDKLTRLSIDALQVSGPIPPELGNLSNLEYLFLGNNQLSGSMPPELGNLSNLEYLNLNNNQLSGSILPELGSLSNLESLSLDNNQLSGSIPLELVNLSNLESLFLGTNQLSGSIPPELGSLSNLESLGLNINQLSGSIPPELGNLSNLESLYLNNNQLSGSIPPELGNLTNLERLYLHANQLSGAFPPELVNLTNLESLLISGNQLSGCIPNELMELYRSGRTDFDQLGLLFC